jgi:hypothetical protein
MTQAQRVMAILGDGKAHSHHEFYGFCVLHSRISELRKKGFNIACWRDGDNYVYQLLPSLETVREPGEVAATAADSDPLALGPSPPERFAPDAAVGPAEAGFGPSPEDPNQTQLPSKQLEIWSAAA